MPFWSSSFDFWYAFTAFSVPEPKTPSALIFSSFCSALTASPVDPRRILVLR